MASHACLARAQPLPLLRHVALLPSSTPVAQTGTISMIDLLSLHLIGSLLELCIQAGERAHDGPGLFWSVSPTGCYLIECTVYPVRHCMRIGKLWSTLLTAFTANKQMDLSARRYAPSAERNQEPIRNALARVPPWSGSEKVDALEIASVCVLGAPHHTNLSWPFMATLTIHIQSHEYSFRPWM